MEIENLKKLLEQDYGVSETEEIVEGLRVKRYVTLRVNTLKTSKDEVIRELKKNNVLFQEVSWYSDALVILNVWEDFIRNLDIYKRGEIYLQSLSSMIPALIVNPKEGENILDMTAAPGGKTTQMAALGNNKVMITAVEKNKIRWERLKYNIAKLGAKKISVLNEDARNLNENFIFDKILLDAPCSGSGTIKIEDGSCINEFSLELVERSVKIQEILLRKALNIIKNNQILVYATCSILKREDEDIILKCMKEFNLEVVPIDEERFLDIPKLSSKIKGAMVVKPNRYYEGFFVICLRKK